MSGFYNNWIKVNNPTMSNDIVQMESGGFQTPFYFGGSQVPTDLGFKESKFKTKHGISTSVEKIGMGINSQRTYQEKQNNIKLPRNLPSITK